MGYKLSKSISAVIKYILPRSPIGIVWKWLGRLLLLSIIFFSFKAKPWALTAYMVYDL